MSKLGVDPIRTPTANENCPVTKSKARSFLTPRRMPLIVDFQISCDEREIFEIHIPNMNFSSSEKPSRISFQRRIRESQTHTP